MSTVDIKPDQINIITFPHPTLRYVAKPIRRVDAKLKEIVDRMFELMYEHRGVGLAATQVDLPLRMFVMNEAGDRAEGEQQVLINPVLSKPKGNVEAEEGCLSLPNVLGDVIRAKSIHIHAFDLQGNEIDRVATGFEARVMQHETDHLDGMLFVDRMKESNVEEVVAQMDLLQTDFRSRQSTNSIPSDEELLLRLKDWEATYC